MKESRRRSLFLALALGAAAIQLLGAGRVRAGGFSSQREPLPQWGGLVAINFLSGDIIHEEFEARLADFQSSSGVRAPVPVGFCAAVRRDDNYLELDWSVLFGTRLDFMDDDHFFEINETNLVLLFRRRLPVATFSSWFVDLLPGAGIGYSWALADVGIYGNASGENVAGRTTSLVEASGPMYVAGAILIATFGKNGGFAGFEYQYRFHTDTKSTLKNGGEVFFPSNPSFDFSGHYFGIIFGLSG